MSIGSQCSQALGLIYLDNFNHYLKEELHLKYVINYVDDFVILHNDKNYLNKCFKLIKDKIKEYKLELNIKKSKIDSIDNGIDFLGYRFYIKNNRVIMKLRNSTKKNIRKKVKNIKRLLDNKYITYNDSKVMLSSYKGYLKYGSCKRLWYCYVRKIL